MDVSVIIVNYNTKELTAACIDSIFSVTRGVSFEVIVVDNASSDGSRERFRSDGRITFIESERNLGFGKANNLGLERAVGRNVLFLNSDTLLINNAIKILSDFLDGHEDAGVCGGNLSNAEGEPVVSFEQSLPSLYGYVDNILLNGLSHLRYGRSIKFNYRKKPLEVSYISGADLMIKRRVLDEVGAFDPAFFMYYEEIELCCRVAAKGYRIFSVPEARITHLLGKSCVFSEKMIVVRHESRKKYFQLTHGRAYSSFADALYFVLVVTRIAEHWITRNPGKTRQWTVALKLLMNRYAPPHGGSMERSGGI